MGIFASLKNPRDIRAGIAAVLFIAAILYPFGVFALFSGPPDSLKSLYGATAPAIALLTGLLPVFENCFQLLRITGREDLIPATGHVLAVIYLAVAVGIVVAIPNLRAVARQWYETIGDRCVAASANSCANIWPFRFAFCRMAIPWAFVVGSALVAWHGLVSPFMIHDLLHHELTETALFSAFGDSVRVAAGLALSGGFLVLFSIATVVSLWFVFFLFNGHRKNEYGLKSLRGDVIDKRITAVGYVVFAIFVLVFYLQLKSMELFFDLYFLG